VEEEEEEEPYLSKIAFPFISTEYRTWFQGASAIGPIYWRPGRAVSLLPATDHVMQLIVK
jgi:hypothetical protein